MRLEDAMDSLSTSKQAVVRRRTVPSRRRRDGLIHYASNTTSQHGEDGILKRLFALLPTSNNYGTDRWCVDVGAWDGVHWSNTNSLLQPPSKEDHDDTWRGVLIEADVAKFQQLCQLYAYCSSTPNEVCCLNVTVTVDRDSATTSLHEILRNQQQHKNQPSQEQPESIANNENCASSSAILPSSTLPDHFDFLCIDIDGNDYWVLHDLWEFSSFRPTVVCVEFNPTMPDDLIYIPPRNDRIRHGASLAALVELATMHKYVLVETTLYNAFFVGQSHYDQYLRTEVPDTSIEALHEPSTMGTSIYQLYDGELKLWGCKKLLWHRLPMDETKIQVLSEQQRYFPFGPAPTSDPSHIDDSDVVDVSSFCIMSPNSTTKSECKSIINERRQACSASLLLQLQEHGFCLVRGIGVDHSLCQAALEATNSFLHVADEDVRRSCLASDRARRGYSPMNVENFASLLGEHGPNDLVRKFRVGPILEIEKDNNGDMVSPQNSLLQPNAWPSEAIWTQAKTFQSVVEEYYIQLGVAARDIVHAICEGLLHKYPDLSLSLQPLLKDATTKVEDNDDKACTSSILTLLGYRAGTRHKGKNKGPLVAAHTDVGVITILLFDGGPNTCATLQRRSGCEDDSVSRGWIDVVLPAILPPDPIFVVHIADCLSELSQGRVPSTVHRVIANRDRSTVTRNCCALFVGLDPASSLTMADGRILSYEEWRKMRIAKAHNTIKTGTTA